MSEEKSKPEDIDTHRIIVAGRSGSGKTHLVHWLLRQMPEDSIDELLVYSSTATPEDWEETTPSRVYTEWSPARVARQMDRPGHKVFIVDDMLGVIKRDDPTLVTLFTKGRHHGATVVLITQKLTGFFPVIRQNATDLYLCRTKAAVELDSLHRELATTVLRKKEDWYAFVEKNTRHRKALHILMVDDGEGTSEEDNPFSVVKPSSHLEDMFVEPQYESDEEQSEVEPEPLPRASTKYRKKARGRIRPLPPSTDWRFIPASAQAPPKAAPRLRPTSGARKRKNARRTRGRRLT